MKTLMTQYKEKTSTSQSKSLDAGSEKTGMKAMTNPLNEALVELLKQIEVSWKNAEKARDKIKALFSMTQEEQIRELDLIDLHKYEANLKEELYRN